MLALKDKCLHPETKKPYIKSSVGGVDKSIEGMQVSRVSPTDERNLTDGL